MAPFILQVDSSLSAFSKLCFRESGIDLIEIEVGYTEKLEKRFLKKETAIYHFDVYLSEQLLLFCTKGNKTLIERPPLLKHLS